jgi:uncharacterized protein (DUF2062 family)
VFRALRRGAARLLRLHGTPHGIALGFTLGVGLSLIPVPFLGMVLAIVCAPLIRASVPATYLGTAVVNPVTGAAFYFAELWLGSALLGVPVPAWNEAQGWSSEQWLTLLGDLLPAFALGGGLTALGASVTVYPLVRALVGAYQRRAAPAATTECPEPPPDQG